MALSTIINVITLLIVKLKISFENKTINSLIPRDEGVTEAKLERTDIEL